MRIGLRDPEPVELRPGDPFTLTTDDITGMAERVAVSFKRLPRAVKPGDRLFLSDGIIQLEVLTIQGEDAGCKVLEGGARRSCEGLNLPGIDLGISAFKDHLSVETVIKRVRADRDRCDPQRHHSPNHHALSPSPTEVHPYQSGGNPMKIVAAPHKARAFNGQPILLSNHLTRGGL